MAMVLGFRWPPISWFFTASVIFSMVVAVIICTTSFMHSHFLPMIGERVETEKIVGDVYHSAEVFQMDYAEMERKFKIHVYPFDQEDWIVNTELISGKYASEAYFFMNIAESSFVTDDPDQAHLFFIPVSCRKLQQTTSSYEEMTSMVANYMEGLILKYPYWNRTLGTDHIFLTCDDIDVGATEGVPMLVKNSIRVVCSPSYETPFIPHKDVSLPLVMQRFSQPASTTKGTDNRTILGYWAGVCNSNVRKKLVNLWGKDNELDVQNNTKSRFHRINKFYSAKFCICPRGSRLTTSRITMAIHYGCVPVILADYFDLPFKDVLDWRKFSVILNERDVYRLKDI